MDYFISVSPMGGYFNENIIYTSLITKTTLKKINFLVLRRLANCVGDWEIIITHHVNKRLTREIL